MVESTKLFLVYKCNVHYMNRDTGYRIRDIDCSNLYNNSNNNSPPLLKFRVLRFFNILQYIWYYYELLIMSWRYGLYAMLIILWIFLYQKWLFFDEICRHEYYTIWAPNGIKLFLTLQASIFVIAHHIDLVFVLCNNSTLWFSLFWICCQFGWKKNYLFFMSIVPFCSK